MTDDIASKSRDQIKAELNALLPKLRLLPSQLGPWRVIGSSPKDHA